MVADGMLTRKRYREVPPRVDYALTERARDLLPVLGALARVGLRVGVGHAAWSRRRVEIGAIFRLAPGLATEGPRERHGQAIVTDNERCAYRSR